MAATGSPGPQARHGGMPLTRRRLSVPCNLPFAATCRAEQIEETAKLRRLSEIPSCRFHLVFIMP